MNDDTNTITQNLVSELRRGTLVLSVLSRLKEQQYGYSLKQCLAEEGIDIDQGTLYPLLRRLEKQGLLVSDWIVEENRPRRYYQLNETGAAVLEGLAAEWKQMVSLIDKLLEKED
ncbi:MAG: helix-turn-helix transcriptional regulator [Anaerolineales bacterium]|nr:helix-turn-helix transcriptional regulator [Anaerolineales bacterium]